MLLIHINTIYIYIYIYTYYIYTSIIFNDINTLDSTTPCHHPPTGILSHHSPTGAAGAQLCWPRHGWLWFQSLGKNAGYVLVNNIAIYIYNTCIIYNTYIYIYIHINICTNIKQKNYIYIAIKHCHLYIVEFAVFNCVYLLNMGIFHMFVYQRVSILWWGYLLEPQLIGSRLVRSLLSILGSWWFTPGSTQFSVLGSTCWTCALMTWATHESWTQWRKSHLSITLENWRLGTWKFPLLVGGLEHFFIFHHIWDNPSHWLIFFKMDKTTNQIDLSQKKCAQGNNWLESSAVGSLTIGWGSFFLACVLASQ